MGGESELETEGTSEPLGCARQSDCWAQNLPSHRNTGMLLSYCLDYIVSNNGLLIF